MEDEKASAVSALNSIIKILNELDDDERQRILRSISVFFQIEPERPVSSNTRQTDPIDQTKRSDFSTDYAPSAKEFLLQKQPKTDVERIACLAYYLTHFRDTPFFKGLDLAKLNTEAAQPKFSNVAYASQNALNMGYLAAATKGQRQISAAGEQFVQALPDRDAARVAMAAARPRRPSRKKTPKEEQEVS